MVCRSRLALIRKPWLGHLGCFVEFFQGELKLGSKHCDSGGSGAQWLHNTTSDTSEGKFSVRMSMCSPPPMFTHQKRSEETNGGSGGGTI